jgi:hypothetical protein
MYFMGVVSQKIEFSPYSHFHPDLANLPQSPFINPIAAFLHKLRPIRDHTMTTDSSACKNCTSYTDRHDCTKGRTFLTDFITEDGERVITTPHRNSVCVQHQMRKGLPKVFYVRPTTCADCFHFSAEPFEFEPPDSDTAEVFPAGCGYGNEMCISVAPKKYRPIQASDKACEEHETETEMEIEDEKNRAGIEREASKAEAARQSEASAERITMQVLGKLRKGNSK